MPDYHARKAARTAQFERCHGVKMIVCSACNGSGHYDNDGSPPCGSCGGSGKVRGRLNALVGDPVPVPYTWRDKLCRNQQIKVARKGRR